ncbi:hypothetical protein ACWDR0_17635 [Streptomyces sp. NPDC003691]
MPPQPPRPGRARPRPAGTVSAVRGAPAVLAVLATVLLVLCPALGAAGAAERSQEAGDRTVVTAPEGAAGCGNGAGGGERDAQPATPPRGPGSHEPPPSAPYEPHCGTPAHGRGAAAAGPALDGRPPPLVPLSPEQRSILRV